MRFFILVCVVGLIVSCAGNGSSKSPETRNSDVPAVAEMTSPVDAVTTVEVGASDLVDSIAPPHETVEQLDVVDTNVPEEVAPGCPPGTPCDDGDPCTNSDQCTDTGGCQGVALLCDDENPCTEDSCDAAGECENIPLVKECDDGNPCSVDDLCLDGECTAGLGELDCDDGNPCTDDSCVENVGCDHENNGVTCDDGNLCTEEDVCSSGACSPGPNKCGCLSEEDCAKVDDDNLCNGSLTCDDSLNPPACVIAVETIVQCNDPAPGPCLAWSCNPGTGECITEPSFEGEGCNDNDDCTTDDKCVAGECTGDYVPSCGVGAPCVKWDDCVNGLTCFDGMPGGYCTVLNCKIAECPGGSQCAPINNGQLQVCMALCESNSDCREEFGHGCTGGGGCWCGEEICQAGDPFCMGEVQGICNACGSTLEPDKVDCSLQDQFCFLGECVDCVPQCDGKECGPDGCGGSCGECGEVATCLLESGTCCTPNCQDKECGSNGCGGSCGPCQEPATCNDGVCAIPDPE